jgi:hypothetical protein
MSYDAPLKGTGLEILRPPVLSMVVLGGALFGFDMWWLKEPFQ